MIFLALTGVTSHYLAPMSDVLTRLSDPFISKIAKGGQHCLLKVILNWAATLQDVSKRTR